MKVEKKCINKNEDRDEGQKAKKKKQTNKEQGRNYGKDKRRKEQE